MSKEEKDKQVNFRVAETILTAFDTAADARGINRTEALTRLMIVYGGDHKNASTHHLDGEPCPLTQLLDGIRHAVVERMKP